MLLVGRQDRSLGRPLAFRPETLGQRWFGVWFSHVGVIAGRAKDLAAEVAFLGVYITDLRSAVGALCCGASPAGIAVSIFYASDQDDLTGTRRRHSETLTHFFQRRPDVLFLRSQVSGDRSQVLEFRRTQDAIPDS